MGKTSDCMETVNPYTSVTSERSDDTAVDNQSSKILSDPGQHWWLRVVTEPLLHFLLIGLLIFGLHSYIEKSVNPDDRNMIRVSPQMVNQIASTWERQWRRPPTDAELENLINSNIQEEVLYREALAMNLDQNDTIVRRWLVQKMDFLSRDMIPPVDPTDEDIKAYFESHQSDYVQPARISFTHIFFDADRRGLSAEDEAVAVLQQLNRADPVLDRAPQLGDRFMLNYDYTGQEPQDVRQYFGKDFADQLFELEQGRWQGPITSGYGLHLVRVTDRRDPEPAELETVYDDVQRTLIDERRQEANAAFYQALLAKYTVEIDENIQIEHPDLTVALANGFIRHSGAGFNIKGY